MKSRRGDIRTARKSEPSAALTTEDVPARSLRNKRSLNKSVGNIKTVSSDILIKKKTKQKMRRVRTLSKKPKNTKIERASKVAVLTPDNSAKTPPEEVNENSSNIESKRRRTNAAEYIKKRFLYDIDEEPKRSKHRKPQVTRLPVAAVSVPRRSRMQIKHGWHTGSPSDDGSLPLRSRRGRRVKPKQDYSPIPHDEDVLPQHMESSAPPRRFSKKRKGKRGRKQQTPQEFEINQRRSTWELPDLFNADDNDQIDDLSQSESGLNDGHKQRFPDTTDLPNYSDVLLDTIPNRTTILALDDHDRRRRALREQLRRSDHRRFHHRHLANPNVIQKDTNSLNQQTLLSPSHSSDVGNHPQDIIDFCGDSTTDHFRRRSEFDEFEHTEDEFIQSSGSHAPSEEPSQTPQEELEEEELLAPELSLITSQTDNGATLPGSVNCGGSRRKSPVRPMQVLRTKSHATANAGAQAPMLVSHSDESSFIFSPSGATAGVYNRQLPGGEEYMSTVFQPVSMEKTPSDQTVSEAHFGLKAASVLRLPSSSNTGASAIAIRSIPEHTLQLPVSTECSNSSPGLHSSLLPSILNQNNSRVASQPIPRVFPPAPTASRSTTSISAKSLLSHSTLTASRRRPTILKRGAAANAASVNSTIFGAQRLPVSDVEDTVVGIPASRTIGVFTPVSAQRSTGVVQMATTTANSQSPSAPAKLLQLVTTSSISSPQLATNLTASDKLFGRRPAGSAVLSSNPVSVSTSSPTYVDATETQTNAVHPYRYAVLRGSTDGKRYLVLGNQGLFDKNSSNSVTSAACSISDELLTTGHAGAIDALNSPVDLPLNAHDSGRISELHESEDCSVEADGAMDTDRTPSLRAHLQPSYTFSTTIPAPSTPSVAAI